MRNGASQPTPSARCTSSGDACAVGSWSPFVIMSDVFIHPAAIIETQHIGPGTHVWAFAHVMEDVLIGANCNIGDHCFIESGAVVGDGVTIKNGNMIWEGVTLEDGVFVGPHVFFTNDRYPRSPRLPQARKRYSGHEWLSPTLVRRGASLGAGAVILAGITVGEFAMVGAGAVVTRDVPAYALVIGNPARVRGWVCQCGQPLEFREGTATCGDCGLNFVRSGDSVARK
jgi:UDP-2-acetamido-3-amino-2,3-dideoxy-glucuronate N-acetyltransferase